MSFAPVIDALALPPDARVDRRVPKKMLLEQGAPTAADKRKIQDGVEEMRWIAALKPTNIGVPAFRDDEREYLEIAVLTVIMRAEAKESRLVELLHRAIPYPLLLISAHGGAISLSLAHKRWSQGETGKVVIEEVRRTAPFDPNAPTYQEAAFLVGLKLSTLSGKNLFTLYQGWLDRVTALEAARITGVYAPPDSPEQAAARRESLDDHARLRRELAALRAQAQKEKQIKNRVDLNIEIKRLETELDATAKTI